MKLKKLIENKNDQDTLFVNGDDIVARQYLESQSIEKLRDFIGDASLLIIDEAQYVEKVGLNLKLIVGRPPARHRNPALLTAL